MPKCQNAKMPQNAKYNNATLKIVSNVARAHSCLSFPKPLNALPLDMVPLVPRASRRGLSNAKKTKYTKIPKCCQNAKMLPKCQNAAKMLPKCYQNAKMPKYKNAKIPQKCKNATKIQECKNANE